MTESPASLVPVRSDERIELLDILRGFAIFGILPVNMLFFSSPLGYLLDPPWTSFADRAAITLINFFFSAKFYSLFALLFGIGFAIQVERAKDRGADVRAFWWRRMLGLLVIGYAHVAVLWYGDILHLYALLGLVLLIFRDHSGEDLLRPAAVSLAMPILLVLFVMAFELAVPASMVENASWKDGIRSAETISAYRSSDAREIASQRWRDYRELEAQSVVYLPQVFGMFLLGVWAWRSGLVRHTVDRIDLLRRILGWSLIVGLPSNLVFALGEWHVDPTRVAPLTAVVLAARFIAGASVCLTYATGIALLHRRSRWRRSLSFLAPIGRTALSNYLLQSLVCTTIFYGYGLGLYGSTGPAFGMTMALAIFAVQIPLSAVWLHAFRFGPVERIWRMVSYGF